MDTFIADAPVEVKIKLNSSMFPEKIEFDGKTYRTTKYSQVLDLILAQSIISGGKYILICIKCLPLPHGRQRFVNVSTLSAAQGGVRALHYNRY